MSDTTTAARTALPKCPEHTGRTRTREGLEGTERYCTKRECTWSEITEPATIDYAGDPLPVDETPADGTEHLVKRAPAVEPVERHQPQTVTSDLPTIEEMVAAVRAHATTYYDNGNGWDAVVEAWTDEHIAALLPRVRTVAGAIRKVGQRAWEANEARKEIEATAF